MSTAKRIGVVTAAIGLVGALGSTPALAVLTSPADGAVVAGNVFISENQGGGSCGGFGDTRFRVVSTGGAVHLDASKGAPGPWSLVWSTFGRPNDSYWIESYRLDVFSGWLGCSLGGYSLIDRHLVHLRNRVAITPITTPGSGYWGEQASFRYRVTDVATGRPVPGHPTTLQLGSYVASTATDGSGFASFAPTTPSPSGSTLATASALQTTAWIGSVVSTPFDVLAHETAVSYSGATSGTRGSTVELSASLTDVSPTGDNGAPIAGREIVFSLGGLSASATTGPDGVATTDLVLDEAPDMYTLTASFAGDGLYGASSDAVDFDLRWEYIFSDLNGGGTVNLNVSTKEFQYAGPLGTSAIVLDPGMLVVSAPTGPTEPGEPTVPDPSVPVPPDPACVMPDAQSCLPVEGSEPCGAPATEGCDRRAVSVSYADGTITLSGRFELVGGAFAATVVFGEGAEALGHHGTLPEPPG